MDMVRPRVRLMSVLATVLSMVLVAAGFADHAAADTVLDADGNAAPVYLTSGSSTESPDDVDETAGGTGSVDRIADVKGKNAAVRALAAHLKTNNDKARARLNQELAASRLGAELQQMVGSAAAGHYVDSHGRAVVNVTTDTAAQTVRAAGAEPRVVEYSLVELERTKQALDRLAQESGAGQVRSWGIDVIRDRVHVITGADTDDPQTTDFLIAARSNDAVRVSTTSAQMITTADLLGGQSLDSSGTTCSLGFNAEDVSGNPVLLTAGHCAQDYATFTHGGVEVGTVTSYTYPGSGDYAEAPITNTDYWSARGTVTGDQPSDDSSKKSGHGAKKAVGPGIQAVAGDTAMAVGASICKSGRATGWTCGKIESIDNTVNYNNQDGSTSIVSGLIQTTACSEDGDSGGANLSGDQAQGLTSGAAGYDDDGNPLTPPVCGAKVHKPDISWVQPISVPLTAYGLTLVTDSASR
jgi:streptogrisin C